MAAGVSDKADYYYANATARTADQGNVAGGKTAEDMDTSNRWVRSSTGWIQISTAGAEHGWIKGSDIPAYGNILKDNLWGDELTKIAAPGAVVLVADMRYYGRAYFGLLTSGAVATHRVQIAWSQSGADADKSAYTDLLAAGSGPGNIGAEIPSILDNYAHFLITQSGAVENIYAYLTGRELK